MSQQKLNQEINKLTPSALLELFEIDARNIGMPDILYFHPGTNDLLQPIVFDSNTYYPLPLEASGFEMDGKGSLPRPKIRVANVKGLISNFLLQWNNLIGAKVIRRRVFLKYIDAVNFPNGINPYGTSDPNAAFPDDIFKISRKIQETKEVVDFELGTPLEIDNIKLPKRPLWATICPFKYRDPETCGYSGPPIADKANKVFGAGGYGFTLVDQGAWSSATTYNQGDYVYVTSVLDETYGDKFYFVCKTDGTSGSENDPNLNSSNWIADSCPRSIAACKLRFPTGDLPFGGFPGVARGRFIDR